jgi:hypothetical protein
MKRLTFCLLLAMLALSGCGGSSTTRLDSSSAGATNTMPQSEFASPWANDPNFIAPAI